MQPQSLAQSLKDEHGADISPCPQAVESGASISMLIADGTLPHASGYSFPIGTQGRGGGVRAVAKHDVLASPLTPSPSPARGRGEKGASDRDIYGTRKA